MKIVTQTIVIDYALALARKFYSESVSSKFTVSRHKLSEYRKAIEDYQPFDMKLDFEQKQVVLFLLGSSFYNRNGMFLWDMAVFFHNTPTRALQFINRVTDETNPLVKNGIIIFEEQDFTQNILSVDDLANFYRSRRVYLSPIALTFLFDSASGGHFQGFPSFRLQPNYQNVDELLDGISSLVRYLFFLTNFFKMIYSPSDMGNDDIYEKGDFATSLSKLRKAILKSPLDIELIDFLKKNKFSNLEFVFLILLIYKVVIAKEFMIASLEELLHKITFTASQTRTILKCFSKDSVFVKENLIEHTDYFTPFPFYIEDEEINEMDGMMEQDDFDSMLPFDMSAIPISKERIYKLIFTNFQDERGKLQSKVDNADELEDLDRSDTPADRIRVKGLYEIIIPRVSIENVILDEDVKKNLLGAVDMTKTVETMEEWHVKPTLSAKSYSSIKVLLYGPSGTGKTITAEALAGEAGAELFKVDASNLVTSWVGESSKNVKKVFKEFYRYRKQSSKKVFMFFNEADQLLSARGTVMQAADKEYNQMQNILLEELENFDGVFIATTNLIDIFDTAWNRRFNVKIKFDIPKFDTRLRIWQVHIPEKLPLAEDVDVAKLAETELAGGSIANVVYNAARKAALREGSQRIVTQRDFLDAIKHELASQVGGKKNKVGFN